MNNECHNDHIPSLFILITSIVRKSVKYLREIASCHKLLWLQHLNSEITSKSMSIRNKFISLIANKPTIITTSILSTEASTEIHQQKWFLQFQLSNSDLV